MRKDLISIGGDFSIEDAEGNVAYDVDRKVRFATTFVIKDREGRALVSAKEKLMALDGTIILTRDGATEATVRTVGGISNPKSFRIELADGTSIEAQGRFFVDDEYALVRDGQRFANVTQERYSLREIYKINIARGEDEPLVLAMIASITLLVPHTGDPS